MNDNLELFKDSVFVMVAYDGILRVHDFLIKYVFLE